MLPREGALPFAVAAAWTLVGLAARGPLGQGALPLRAVTVRQVVDTSRKAQRVANGDTAKLGDRRCLSSRPGDCLAEPVPADEPHGAVCGMCHDLWKRQPLAKSVRSCTERGCHTNPRGLTPFHRTVDSTTLTRCTSCHVPHRFRISGHGEDCTVCHGAGGVLVSRASASRRSRLASGLTFTHEDHTTVPCVTCHGSGALHGTLAVRSVEACRACHHSPPLSGSCTRCHAVDEVRATSFDVTKALNIHVGSLNGPVRTIHFDHARHWRTDCTVCHTGGTDLGTAEGADCSGCHLEHHEGTTDCTGCHDAPLPGAHTRTAHLGCGGPGCHDPVPAGIRHVPKTRQLCLSCHRTLTGHEVGRNCSDCHVLPAAGP